VSTAIEFLATAMKDRRKQIGITGRELADATGLGLSTIQMIEAGKYARDISTRTLHSLDIGLRWESGSAAATLDGGKPTPLHTEGWPNLSRDWPAYVATAQREREAQAAAEVAEGSRAALETFEQVRTEHEGRPIGEFSDGELIAELARRLARTGRAVTPPADGPA
jgi:transcriptional regulator with XRE-family HTH domain